MLHEVMLAKTDFDVLRAETLTEDVKTAVKAVNSEMIVMNQSFMRLCGYAGYIRENLKVGKKQAYKSFRDFAAKAFGWSGSTADNYARIGVLFTNTTMVVNEDGTRELHTEQKAEYQSDLEKFGVARLMEMSSLSDEDRQMLINEKQITPEMKVTEVKEAVALHKEVANEEVKERAAKAGMKENEVRLPYQDAEAYRIASEKRAAKKEEKEEAEKARIDDAPEDGGLTVKDREPIIEASLETIARYAAPLSKAMVLDVSKRLVATASFLMAPYDKDKRDIARNKAISQLASLLEKEFIETAEREIKELENRAEEKRQDVGME